MKEQKEIYFDACKDPDGLPKFHKRLMWTHIIYLFVLSSLVIFFNDMYFEGSGWFRFSAWLLLAMFVGFYINNYKIAINKGKAMWQVLSVPMEILLISLIFDWDLYFEIIEWGLIEFVGFFIGLLVATVFRKAPITMGHRILSFFLVFGFCLVIYLGFSDFIDKFYFSGNRLFPVLITIPIATSIYNNTELFIRDEMGGKNDVNMGTTVLSDRMTPVLGIFVLIWFFLPSIGKALGS